MLQIINIKFCNRGILVDKIHLKNTIKSKIKVELFISDLKIIQNQGVLRYYDTLFIFELKMQYLIDKIQNLY